MSLSQTIESHDKSVADLLADFYVVPDYQREYVWEEEQIDQLCDDIHAEFASGENPPSEYFIGSIVVCRGTDDRFELIDGQQRLTTLFVLLCAIRDHLDSRGASVPAQLGTLISAHGIDALGNDVFRHRVELQYADSGDALVMIAEGRGSDFVTNHEQTRSIDNLRNAYRLTREFLARQFVDDDQAVRRFFAYLTQKVKLIRIGTQSVAHALKIFETINDRGKGLDSMDLLKNLMFMQVKSADFAKLKVRWKELVDTLYEAPEKPLRFLRYFIFATYDVDRLKEEEIYGWFVKNKERCGYEAKPLAFVEQLFKAAQAYNRFSHAQDPLGTRNRYLQNIRFLSGAARQHFILLLAGRDVSPSLFSEMARQLENLLFVFVITRENTREFERKFAQWASEVRRIDNAEELKAWVARRIEPEKLRLAARFDLTMRDLDLSLLQKYRQRYLLAKLTQHVNEQGFGAGSQSQLDAYVNKDVHIEHVFPQNPSPAALAEFGGSLEEGQRLTNRLGNLVLIEKPLNTSVGNRAYSAKRIEYPKSKFLLTRTLAIKVAVGTNTSVNRAVEGFTPFDTWSSHTIRERQGMLTALARRVWEVPGGAATSSEMAGDERGEVTEGQRSENAAPDVSMASTRDINVVHRNNGGAIANPIEMSAADLIGQRVVCPACGDKVFESWPAGWDGHAAHACTGLSKESVENRRAEYRRRFGYLFKR